MNIQPFSCNIKSGTKKERDEFKRLFVKSSNKGLRFNFVYYGYDIYGSWNMWATADLAKKNFTRILPLSEGIEILKGMVGEVEEVKVGWQDVKDEPPQYYGLNLCYGNNSMAVCWRTNDGENDIYIIAGTDKIMQDVTH